MKKIIINISLLLVLAGAISSCKKQLADDYQNPELTTTGSMGKLFAGMFFNKRIHPSYWDYYTMVMPITAAFSQTAAIAPVAQMYVPNTSYTENRWVDFYAGVTGTDYNYDGPGILANYREMQTTYAGLNASNQAAQEVFLKCGQVLLYDQAAQLIDMWGDIPFFNANSLNGTSRSVTNAAFDDAEALYDTMITNLASLNTYFANVSLVSTTATELATDDMMFKGSMDYWRRYANSLRLRLLMRISNYDETTAKAAVTTMLNDATTYPLISSNTYNAVVKMSPNTYQSDLLDVFTGYPYAPAYLMDTVMVNNGDPRTAVYWDPNYTNGYKGFPSTGTNAEYSNGGYATYDSATFFYNYSIPAVLFTASEVSFLQAEAYERWNLGSSQTAYNTGISQSVDFYYGINQSRTARTGAGPWTTLTTPDATTVSTFENQSAIALGGTTAQNLAKIYTQKWVHFFILQAGQAWAEYRRTGYPALSFATATQAGNTTPPVRLLYPSSEKLYNADNYSKVSAKDTRDTKVFWDVN